MSLINEKVIVGGGLAGDNNTFSKTFVFLKDKIISNGAVGEVLLKRKKLSFYQKVDVLIFKVIFIVVR